MDETTWLALTVVLAVLGAVWTWTAFRRRGSAAGLRALAWTLIPVALGLTGTLRLAGDIASDVSRWAGRLVLSPTVWAGLAAGGISVVLFLVSGWMLGRGKGVKDVEATKRTGPASRPVEGRSPAPEVGAAPAGGKHSTGITDVDDDVADILKKHGIE